MLYRLGNLRPQPTPSELHLLLSRHDLSTFIERWRERLSTEQRAPDLLDTLRDDPGPDSWAFDVADVLQELGRSRHLSLAWCERQAEPDGYLTIAVVDESTMADVREGDSVAAGFVAHRDAWRGVEVAPRVYRKVCANGAIVHVGDEQNALGNESDLRETVRACLSGTRFADRVSCLRSAAATPAGDPLALLAAARVPPPHARVLDAREPGDDTVYGVLNAVTAHARSESHLGRRLEFERAADRILQVAAAGIAVATAPIG